MKQIKTKPHTEGGYQTRRNVAEAGNSALWRYYQCTN